MNQFLLILGCIVFMVLHSVAQPTVDAAAWKRIQTDDGDFSVEVPKQSVFFYNREGFSISDTVKNGNQFIVNSRHLLKNVNFVSSYVHGTLISLESYDSTGSALDDIYIAETFRVLGKKETKNEFQDSVINRKGYSIRQTVQKINGATVYRQYIGGKKRIYILTTASRNGETPEMHHFLDSVKVSVDKMPILDPNVPIFSQIPKVEPVIEMRVGDNDNKSIKGRGAEAKPSDADKSVIKPTMLMQLKAEYTDSARMKRVTGSIKLRLTLSADGNISRIVVLQTLPEGLLRQTLFAALRIKFLPQEKNGVAETAEVTREYSFDIY